MTKLQALNATEQSQAIDQLQRLSVSGDWKHYPSRMTKKLRSSSTTIATKQSWRKETLKILPPVVPSSRRMGSRMGNLLPLTIRGDRSIARQ